MGKYYFGQFGKEHLEAIGDGIKLFNSEHFWECHEVLEDLWLEHTGDNAKYVYWSVIQIAASLYHYRNDNLVGAWGMLKKAKNKIQAIKEKHVESDLLYDYLSWEELCLKVSKINESSKLEEYVDLYQFKFQNPDDWDLSKVED